ncbi:hypothetical protein IEE87_27155 (plasmid) [Klebsiella pneumoniae]|nr:hypothetical protein IEE87_27155 [Klebsiella pneumoniae]
MAKKNHPFEKYRFKRQKILVRVELQRSHYEIMNVITVRHSVLKRISNKSTFRTIIKIKSFLISFQNLDFFVQKKRRFKKGKF